MNLRDKIRVNTNKFGNNWDSILPLFMMSIRNTPTSKHCMSLAEIIFNRKIILPIHDLNETLSKMYKNELLRKNSIKYQKRIKFYYDKKALKKPSKHNNNFEMNHPVITKQQQIYKPKRKRNRPKRFDEFQSYDSDDMLNQLEES
ncbi:hypothetical protein A3Q56_08475 [Intoshia linei]|uniref:Uncharacterized protein n=1 Tax=Intoshia linei TaxID=1819745 RepID=A0A177AP82_9BILA|nr:hypothetical protein A3Q56_08475 [Intoshia linei]